MSNSYGSVTTRMHASWARQLIAACGGLDEAATACRLKKSRLSQCQDPDADGVLPADVITDLEGYCGSPVYSQRMAEHRPSRLDAQALMDEAMEAAEATSGLQAMVREAIKDGHLSPRERDALRLQLERAQEELRQVGEAMERGDAAGRGGAS